MYASRLCCRARTQPPLRRKAGPEVSLGERVMPVELRNEQRVVRIDARRLRRQAESLLAAVGRGDSVLSVLLTDDRRIAPLHERWMREAGPTDVMAFPFSHDPFSHSPILGDIVISAETAARRRPKNPAGEVLRCLAHGLLHLAGYLHRTARERLRMNRETDRLIKRVEAQ